MTILKNCQQCNEQFNASVRAVNRGQGKFCSLRCSTKHTANKNKPKPNVICAHCNKEFYKNKSKQKLSKSGLFFCCKEHKCLAQKIGGVIMPAHYGSNNGKTSYRNKAFKEFEKICQRCGYDKHPAAIVIHHKDKNRNNNCINNLEVLCSNCHAIEHWGNATLKI